MAITASISACRIGRIWEDSAGCALIGSVCPAQRPKLRPERALLMRIAAQRLLPDQGIPGPLQGSDVGALVRSAAFTQGLLQALARSLPAA